MRPRTPTRISTAHRGGAPPRPAGPKIPARRRARSAGGPDDRASYGCACGLLFEEHVSTSVLCPRCGAVQAW